MKKFVKYLKGISGMFWRGHRSFSQFAEDIIINQIFKDKSNGFYLDIGAFHPKIASNTYKLYRKGWRGINIDAENFKLFFFKFFRRKCINIQALITNEDNKEYTFYSPSKGSYGSYSSVFPKHISIKNREEKKLISTKISTLLSKLNINQIDLLTIDIEGLDDIVLLEFDFNKFTPKVICFEKHQYDINKIVESDIYKFLIKKNYKLYSWMAPSLIFTKN